MNRALALLAASVGLHCAPATSGLARAPAPPAPARASPAPAAVVVSAPPIVRFLPGAPPPEPHCFAWSQAREAYACVFGHHEVGTDGTETRVMVLGRTKGAAVPLTKGRLDEPARAALDALMVDGAFVAVPDAPWSTSGAPMSGGAFKVVADTTTIHVEHSGAVLLDAHRGYLRKFTPACKHRLWPVNADAIVLERSCTLRDEGVEVTELDLWFCDATRCT